MRSRGTGGFKGWLAVAVAAAVALATVGTSLAQAPKGKAGAKGAGKTTKKGREAANAKGKAAAARPNAADPIENADPDALDKAAAGMVHYRLKIRASDDTPLNLVYYPAYPARLGINAPVVMMIHEKDRSSRDFEEPIADLKNQGFAEHLQGLGYAVLAVDLRGHGANARKALSPQDWRLMIDDLQAAYQFLVDRHNRGKLNLAKLGVVALGEGANLAAAWANMPGGAVSGEGRTSDLGALVLISPLADGEGFLLRQVTNALAPRVPLTILVGERDQISADPVRSVRPIVERPAGGLKLNRVELFDSSLHGYKLLWLEPRITTVITKFLEGTIKLKATAAWEPRYNLTPVAYGDIQLVRGKPAAAKKDEPKAKEEAKAKEAEPAKEEAKANPEK
jgi:pimeloyl-ACP methyl ester carboxylesterase